ncbi:MAG: twin-arginine translocase subunit TatC [Planctomycetes bacterium]|nr:twin-arginine translocase subunit TatC [Planctomycetota bacterium]
MPLAMTSPKRDEDLFSESTMTFGEHLDELRVVLFKAVIALFIGTCVGMFVGKYAVAIIKAPLEKALQEYYQESSLEQFSEFEEAWKKLDKPVPYTVEQVNDLLYKQQMIFEIQYIHPVLIRQALGLEKAGAKVAADKQSLEPILYWHPIDQDKRISILALGVSEMFSIWLKASLVTGLILSSPFVLYYLWSFVAAGLYRHERRYIHIFLPFSLGLFFAGVLLAYWFVFGPVLSFLFSFNRSMGIDPDPRISEWLGFVLLLPIGFGVSFQLPLVMLFLERIGIITVEMYTAQWKIAVLVIFVISSILTPADPYSLLLMAIPLTGLYFGGVQLCKLMPRRGTGIDPEAISG